MKGDRGATIGESYAHDGCGVHGGIASLAEQKSIPLVRLGDRVKMP